MLLAVLAGFIAALVLAMAGAHIRKQVGYLASLVPAALFIYFLSLVPAVATGGGVKVVYPWVSSLGIHLAFSVDGLSLLFALLISGIGALVFVYTIEYLKGYSYLPRFYAYLSMFMAAMLGLVLSDNLVSLFIFWELTSISSFFLIGFKNEERSSRRSAMVALAITGLGGLFLLAGVLMLRLATGSFSISEILASKPDLMGSGLYGLIVCMFFGAAFTKSAQFPFHFWLPGAMKAPTPVSTYLHSATMVKAGVYLLLRMSPILGGHAYWHTTLVVVGGFTMLYAAFHTLFRTDLKGILAYSTISALGIMIFLTGLGTTEALLAAGMFILVHALYKAALFLVTGALDHATGSRDITRLAGLGGLMPPLAIAGLLAALSSAGLIPFIGFIGKDLIYEATLQQTTGAWWLTGAAIATNVLLLSAGLLAGIKPFIGPLPPAYDRVAEPAPLLWVPPLLLGSLGLLFGMVPGLVSGPLVLPLLQAVGGAMGEVQVKLWHGFNNVFLLSTLTIIAGLAVYWKLKPTYARERAMERLERFSPEQIMSGLAVLLHRMAFWYTAFFQNGQLRRYVRIIILFLTILVGWQILTHLPFPIMLQKLLELTLYEVAILGIMVFATFFVVFTPTRLGAVAGMGVVGYSICLLFVFYSAPDLAMTQFTIDTLTVILFVLVLYKLPKYLKFASRAARFRDWVISLAFGGVITLVALAVLVQPAQKEVGEYYATYAYLQAKGKNI
ncbi:MAG TPA: proton-conducting transporter membrane subunit, partial [Phnomibacter sp.]|nr:proton-conducting transporter membrane subunit [Phnomibacter sp.]